MNCRIKGAFDQWNKKPVEGGASGQEVGIGGEEGMGGLVSLRSGGGEGLVNRRIERGSDPSPILSPEYRGEGVRLGNVPAPRNACHSGRGTAIDQIRWSQ